MLTWLWCSGHIAGQEPGDIQLDETLQRRGTPYSGQ